MTGVFDEGLIEPISKGKAADRKLVDEDSMNWAFVVRAEVGAHQELTSDDEDHFGFDDHRAMSNAGLAGGMIDRSVAILWAPGDQRIRTPRPAIAVPRIGANQNNQSCDNAHPPTKFARPVLRAGSTEVFVTGMLIR